MNKRMKLFVIWGIGAVPILLSAFVMFNPSIIPFFNLPSTGDEWAGTIYFLISFCSVIGLSYLVDRELLWK